MHENETDEQYFERLGPEQVKMLLSLDGLPSTARGAAIRWVAEQEKNQRLRDDKSRSEQMRTARCAKIAAQIAAIAAIITLMWEIVSKIWK